MSHFNHDTNQWENSVVTHWGAKIISKHRWLTDEPALKMLEPELSTAFATVERWDLIVAKVEIDVVSSEHESFLDVRVCADTSRIAIDPELKAQGAYEHNYKAPCCQECYMPLCVGKLHPENGCSLGTIDHVMNT